MTVKAEPGVSSLPASKQEQNNAEEFGPKLPPSFSSGGFCGLVAYEFYTLKRNIIHTSLINVCETVPYLSACAVSNMSAHTLLPCCEGLAGIFLSVLALL